MILLFITIMCVSSVRPCIVDIASQSEISDIKPLHQIAGRSGSDLMSVRIQFKE